MSRSSASPQPAPAGSPAADMQAEIERLTRELDKTSSEKIQSAQYGLVLLEEVKLIDYLHIFPRCLIFH